MEVIERKSIRYRRIGDLCWAFIMGAWLIDLHPNWFLPAFLSAGVIGITFDIISWRIRKKEKVNDVADKIGTLPPASNRADTMY